MVDCIASITDESGESRQCGKPVVRARFCADCLPVFTEMNRQGIAGMIAKLRQLLSHQAELEGGGEEALNVLLTIRDELMRMLYEVESPHAPQITTLQHAMNEIVRQSFRRLRHERDRFGGRLVFGGVELTLSPMGAMVMLASTMIATVARVAGVAVADMMPELAEDAEKIAVAVAQQAAMAALTKT